VGGVGGGELRAMDIRVCQSRVGLVLSYVRPFFISV
jgi:hypothetical protein